MNARQLLKELRSVGITLAAVDGALKVNAPADAWTDDLRARVKESKAEILSALADHSPRLEDGVLTVPFECEPRYRYWEKQATTEPRLSLSEILDELNASPEVRAKYIPKHAEDKSKPTPERDAELLRNIEAYTAAQIAKANAEAEEAKKKAAKARGIAA